MSNCHIPTAEVILPPMEATINAELIQSVGRSLVMQNEDGFSWRLPGPLAVQNIFSCLERVGEISVASLVCSEWQSLSLSLRALYPSTAREVAIRIRSYQHLKPNASSSSSSSSSLPTSMDGEYTLWYNGNICIPMQLYCHNVMSDRPTEFLSLLNTSNNFSMIPVGGSIVSQGQHTPQRRVQSIRTEFSKIRINPRNLMVKTDDYTFATTLGERGAILVPIEDGTMLRQTYWNNQKVISFDKVPFMTARNSISPQTQHAPMWCNPRMGKAMMDLRQRNTTLYQFACERYQFQCMGCQPYGQIMVPKVETPVFQTLAIAGGGFAGRVSPILDRTKDEHASNGNYDDEGHCGGWVLQLSLIHKSQMPTNNASSPDYNEADLDPTTWQLYRCLRMPNNQRFVPTVNQRY